LLDVILIFPLYFCVRGKSLQVMSEVTSETKTPADRGLWLLLALLLALCLSLFVIPAYIIRPFTHQSERGLSLAIAVKKIAPALSLASLAALLATAWVLWRRSSKWLRGALVTAVLLSGASALMVRQNYFEWMFNPIKSAGFVSPADAQLADKEMVMAVTIGPETRAYPIVQMAYHHILNDTVSGVPIVVTY
jgi:hypothetical protein